MATTKPKAETKPKAPKQVAEQVKVYRLKSSYNYLYVAPVKAQFVNGIFETTDIKIAEYLQSYDDVHLMK